MSDNHADLDYAVEVELETTDGRTIVQRGSATTLDDATRLANRYQASGRKARVVLVRAGRT